MDAAVARGVELASLGCAAIEVTLDSPHWAEILQGLREALPPTVLLGVGTVMDESVSQIGRAASLGATFALSPIDPIGMIDECHRRGVLAVPSAFTSNEWYALHRKGARLVKLFHAGLVSPSILKSMLGVTPLGEQINIMPSGGVSPQNTPEWWAAGAAVVGAGSNLVGDDFNHAPGSIEHEKAAAAWAQGGRRAAESAASPEACRGILRVGEQATKAAVSWQIWHVGVVAGAAAGGGQQLEVGVHSNWGRRGVGMWGKSGCEEVPSSSRWRRANGCGRPAGRRFVVFCARNLAATAREAVGAARARVVACAAGAWAAASAVDVHSVHLRRQKVLALLRMRMPA